MSEPFVGEITMFGGNFAPRGWAYCDGQLLPIAQNTALFSLLGTYYGGDGRTTFALPDLRGSTPMHAGQGSGLTQRFLGERGGQETVTLLESELPGHRHVPVARAAAGNAASAQANDWAQIRGQLYGPIPNTDMAGNALSSTGGNQPHNNLAPYQVVSFIIALSGIYPQRP